jgi:hypothetical protein
MTTTADSRIKPVADIETAHLFDIAVDLDPRRDFGNGPLGRRVLFGAAGGSSKGPGFAARCLRAAATGRSSEPTGR